MEVAVDAFFINQAVLTNSKPGKRNICMRLSSLFLSRPDSLGCAFMDQLHSDGQEALVIQGATRQSKQTQLRARRSKMIQAVSDAFGLLLSVHIM
jgi:hypothetical protein